MVAGHNVPDAGADRLDRACTFVAKHDRPSPLTELTVGEEDVGVTHPGGGDTDEHFSGLG